MTEFRILIHCMTSLADYQWLFRRAPVMATSIGDDGRYLDVNDAMLERLGYERDEMIGRRPGDFVTPESAVRIETELIPILRRTGRIENKPIAFLTKSGDVVDCLTSSLVEHDPGRRLPANGCVVHRDCRPGARGLEISPACIAPHRRCCIRWIRPAVLRPSRITGCTR